MRVLSLHRSVESKSSSATKLRLLLSEDPLVPRDLSDFFFFRKPDFLLLVTGSESLRKAGLMVAGLRRCCCLREGREAVVWLGVNSLLSEATAYVSSFLRGKSP